MMSRRSSLAPSRARPRVTSDSPLTTIGQFSPTIEFPAPLPAPKGFKVVVLCGSGSREMFDIASERALEK